MSKKNKRDDLDTRTTFAPMDVDGMPWHTPTKNKSKNSGGPKTIYHKVSRQEQRKMIKGAFLALLPFIGVTVLSLCIVFALAYLWLT